MWCWINKRSKVAHAKGDEWRLYDLQNDPGETNDLTAENVDIVGKLYLAAKQIAADEGVAEPGYRMVMNCNPGAGQSVYHIHLHLLGGRAMAWPPG